MIKKFSSFNENSNIEPLKYYAFDWDDNILNMPTVIHMEKLVNGEWTPTDVSTAEFATVRNDAVNWRILNNDPDLAFSEFRDFGPRGKTAFLEDAKKAISSGNLGPAWHDFIECLINASLFAIITARGHESDAMRLAIEYIIDNVLNKEEQYEMYNNLKKFSYLFNDHVEHDRIMSGKPSDNILVKDYLDRCEFVGVSSPSRGGSPSNPEHAKEEVLMEFNDKINRLASSIGTQALIGFSDDDLKNVKHIEDLIDNLHKERFPNISKFVVKGTKDPMNITKKIRTFETKTAGLESSIVSFANFNNLVQTQENDRFSAHGDETRQDAYGNRLKAHTKFLNKKCKNCKCKNCKCE